MHKRSVSTRIIGLTAVLTAAALGVATGAAAQTIPDTGGRVFGVVGGSFGNGGTALMTAGGAGLRLTRALGIDFEVLHVRTLDLSQDDGFVFPLPSRLSIFPLFRVTREASVTAFLTKFTVDFPVAGGRLIPFVSGGGGIGRVAERISYDFNDRATAAGRLLSPIILPAPDIDRAETGLALTVGGGLDVRLWRGLAVGVDVRWLRLLADQRDFDFAQIASRVSYRF